MTIELFSQVALAHDLPEEALCRGDIATVVELLPGTTASSGEEGCVLEVFNAVRNTIAVVTIPASGVAPLRPTADSASTFPNFRRPFAPERRLF